MSSITDLIRRADEQMRAQFGVDAGLMKIAARVDGGAAAQAPRLLAARRRALEEASARLGRLAADVEHLSAALPFLPDRWPDERDRLRRAIAADPRTGLGEWLGYWLTAASRRRIDAMIRLQNDVQPPVFGSLLAGHMSLATQALADGDWERSHEVLELGCRDLRVGSWRGLKEPVREDLRLLIARLALRYGKPEQADVILATGKGASDSAARLALRSRAARARRKVEEAEALLEEARELDPRDLDATAESITRTRRTGRPDLALDEARTAAEAFRSLGDVEGDLNRLVDVPNELYIALAEQVRDRGDRGCALRLLDRAAAQHDDETMAVVQEDRARLVPSRAERRRALLEAGEWRTAMGQLERARRDFEAAIKPAAQNKEDARTRAVAQLRLADIVSATARQRPSREVGGSLADALSTLLAAREQADATGGESWSYLTESELRAQLAQTPGADRYAQEWGALLAAARALALNPLSTRAWRRLADSAQARSLYRLSEAAAEQGYLIERDEAITKSYAMALTNVGRYEEALAGLDGATDEWSRCVRGYIAMELGKPDEALRYFAAGAIDPRWIWAWPSYVAVLAVTGDLAAARTLSRSFMDISADRLSEREEWEVTAYDACVQGRPAAAVGPARLLLGSDLPGETAGLKAMGMALALQENPKGWNMLAAAISTDPQPTAADDWEHHLRPLLAALAAERHLTLDFAPMEAAVKRAGAADAGDPLVELWNAAGAPGAPGTARPASRLAEAALRATADAYAEQDRLDELLTALAKEDGLDAEAEALRRRLTQEPGRDENAGERPSVPEPPVMRLLLPPSWFAGCADPALRHPLFTRHLPELRRRVAWPVPAVHVTTDETLEPDGYQVLAGDRRLASGRVDPRLRYCAEEALALLPEKVRADPRTVRTEHGWGIPEDAVERAPGLARLITMSGFEIVAMRYGDAVREAG